MSVVLGIDAAWTPTGSSGVALLKKEDRELRFIAAAPSYDGFIGLVAGIEPDWKRPPKTALDVGILLDAATTLGGAMLDTIAIDMPLSMQRVNGRRKSDQEVSVAFGAARAAVHSPTPARPGSYGYELTQAFVAAGFPLAVNDGHKPSSPALVEVYPLAALVRLMGVKERPKYKTARVSRYWRNLPPAERLRKLLTVWCGVLAALRSEIEDFRLPLPSSPNIESARSLKPFEDAIDAVISAWVGACFLEGRAQAFGDAESTIWVPETA